MAITEPIECSVAGFPGDGRHGSAPELVVLVDGEVLGLPPGGGGATPDQLLLNAFVGVRNRTRGPLLAISQRTMITNTSACELLQPADRWSLWEWARRAVEDGSDRVAALVLSNGISVSVRCNPVGDCERRVGAVLQLSVSKAASVRSVPTPQSEPVEVSFPAYLDPSLLTGWIELTDAERAVAELVARGLTNKEAARQIYVSRHTVDSHLRRIFKKLGVTSRVELARLVGEHYEALRGSSIE
jgi:DNA-binding CsgD family transcriptional regulator